MKTQLILIATYVIMFFLYMLVLWWVSKRYKLKRQDFKTAFVITLITFAVSFILLIPYQLGITFPIIIKVLIGIFTLILTPFLIKKFYQISWWKAIKIYLLMLLISIFIMIMIFFVINFLSVTIMFKLKTQERNTTISQTDIDECYLIQDLGSQEKCFMNLLMRTKNRSVCNHINETSRDFCHQVADKFK